MIVEIKLVDVSLTNKQSIHVINTITHPILQSTRNQMGIVRHRIIVYKIRYRDAGEPWQWGRDINDLKCVLEKSNEVVM